MLAALTTEQRPAAQDVGPCLITGAPGTGKTTVLLHQLGELVTTAGQGRVAVLCTTATGVAHWQRLLGLQNSVTILTFGAAAWQGLQQQQPHQTWPILNPTVEAELWDTARRLSGFTGSRHEATLHGRAYRYQKTLANTGPQRALLIAFDQLLERTGGYDTPGLLRAHIQAGRQTATTVPLFDHLVVDHAHDLTALELTWLIDQALAGATLHCAACPTLTTGRRAGALGEDVIAMLLAALPLRRYHFSQNYRHGATAQAHLGTLVEATPEANAINSPALYQLTVRPFTTAAEEQAAVVASLGAQLTALPGQTFALLTRDDDTAWAYAHALQQAEVTARTLLPHPNQTPAVALVYSIGALLCDAGTVADLERVLTAAGLASAMTLTPEVAQAWSTPAPLPALAAATPGVSMRAVHKMHRLRQEFQLAREILLSQPQAGRDLVAGLAAPLLPNLEAADRRLVLAALDAVAALPQGLSPLSLGAWQPGQAAPTHYSLTVAPLREARGLEVDWVYLVGVGAEQFPTRYPTLGVRPEDEKGKLYLGLTRARRGAILSHTGAISPYLTALVGANTSTTPTRTTHGPLPAAVA